MKQTYTLILSILLLSISSIGITKTPLEVVNNRMSAYNNHDIEKFLSLYSEDIQVYDFPASPLGSKGKDHLRFIFAPLFKKQTVKVTIHQQMTNGQYVVNSETVNYENETVEYISIYEVENDLIQSVRFIK